MITRRSLLVSSLATIKFAPCAAASSAHNTLPGAIRSDSQYGVSGIQGDTEAMVPPGVRKMMGPQQFHDRIPWFGKLSSSNTVELNGSQSDLDQEIKWASEAGLKYWAYTWYDPAKSSMMQAWHMHQSSSGGFSLSDRHIMVW